MADTNTFDWQSLEYGLSGNAKSSNTGSQFANTITGINAIANTVFGFLGQSQQTKQSKYELEALTKQKELSAIQGEIDLNLKRMEADIELKKQELVASQKADVTKNIIKIVFILGGLFFLGFVVYLVFKRTDAKVPPGPAAVSTPILAQDPGHGIEV
jgi:hypothetical protein